MSDTIIKPLSAWPLTSEFKTPDGLTGYRVSPHVLTPERARGADGCAEMARVVLFFVCAYGFMTFHTQTTVAVHLIGWIVLFCALARLVRRTIATPFRRTVEIEMTTERVSIKRGKKWERFPRRIEHRFIQQAHDRAPGEQRNNATAQQAASIDRQVSHGSYYYIDSSHIVLELAGHRYDLLTVYGPQEAAAVLARLQYLDRQLDAAVKIGKGVPETPRDEWVDGPGDLA